MYSGSTLSTHLQPVGLHSMPPKTNFRILSQLSASSPHNRIDNLPHISHRSSTAPTLSPSLYRQRTLPRPKLDIRPTFSLAEHQFHSSVNTQESAQDVDERMRMSNSSLVDPLQSTGTAREDFNVDDAETKQTRTPAKFLYMDWYKLYPIPSLPKIPLTHDFHDKRIETRVFTHKSLTKLGPEDLDNEGLEWLGDRLLKTFLGILLFKKDSNLSEGEYTEIMGALENNEFFAHLSVRFGLRDRLVVGSNTSAADIRSSTTVLGGLFEAFVGGVYIDKVAKTDDATALHDMIQWLTPVFEPYLASYRQLHAEVKELFGVSKSEVNVSPIMTKVKDYIRLKGYAEARVPSTRQLAMNLLGPDGNLLVNPWQADLIINGKTYIGVDAKKKVAVTNAYQAAWDDLTSRVA